MERKICLISFTFLAFLITTSGCQSRDSVSWPQDVKQNVNQGEEVLTPSWAQKEQAKNPAAHISVGIILSKTSIREQASTNSDILQELDRGNLIKILSTDSAGEEKWSKIEPICFSYPPNTGYVNNSDYTTDLTQVIPNQGFVSAEKVYSQPDINSEVVSEGYGPVQILQRESGWALCSLKGGANGGWIKENHIKYDFEY